VGEIIEQINKDIPSSTSAEPHDESTHESSLMNNFFLPLQSNNESVLNKISLKKRKSIAKRQSLKNYSQYNSKTKSHLNKLILKEELNAY
jgi:hypothetical protein